MDKIDFQIIEQLAKDAQLPFSKIGKLLGVSHETVRKRYEKLKKAGIIKQCSVIVDRSKIGDQGTAFLLISVKNADDKNVTREALSQINSVMRVTYIMGSYDIIASASIRDIPDLAELVQKVQNIPTVDKLETVTLSYTYFSSLPIPQKPIKCDKVELVTEKTRNINSLE